MNYYRPVAFMTLLLAGSSAAFIFTGCRHQLPAESSIPIEGSVCHVLQPEGSHKTYFDVVVGSGFAGKLPDDVDSIITTGPDGELPIGENSFNYNSQLRNFWLIRSGFRLAL